jgi:hypothetical protein
LNLIQNETPRSKPFFILMQPWRASLSRLGLGCVLGAASNLLVAVPAQANDTFPQDIHPIFLPENHRFDGHDAIDIESRNETPTHVSLLS